MNLFYNKKMLPIELLVHIVKLSDYSIGLKVMSVFNVKNYELFIDMLVEKHCKENITEFKVGKYHHYRYGPAIEYGDETKVWCYRGKLHREDGDSQGPGPAIECIDGTREWYRNGLRHRDFQLPAIEGEDGLEWYENGKRHREVVENDYSRNPGPAIIAFNGDPNDIKEGWYQNDLPHREDGPAITYFNGAKEWYLYGKLHREGNKYSPGPAIDYPERKEWYRHGKLHRVGGPAIITDDGYTWYIDGIIQQYISISHIHDNYMEVYKDGKLRAAIDRNRNTRLYRDGMLYNVIVLGYDGPVSTHIENGMVEESGCEIWYKNGYVHRENGPAIKCLFRKEWYINGKLHREDGPALNHYGDGHWYLNGEIYKTEGFGYIKWVKGYSDFPHRLDGPAIIFDDGSMEWWQNGEPHRDVVGNDYSRDPGPAIEYIDGSKYWYVNGKLHREGVRNENLINFLENEDLRDPGPAIELPDGTKKWYVNGKLHRDSGGPAIEYPNGDKLWWHNDELHRMDGPAIERWDGTKEWYIHGLFCYAN